MIDNICYRIKMLILVFIISMSASVYGASITVQGTVNTLRDNADDLWGEDSDFLLLDGVSSAGSCRKHGGLVVIRIASTEDRAFSMALSAQLAGKEVMVSLDDLRVDPHGFCIMKWLNVVN